MTGGGVDTDIGNSASGAIVISDRQIRRFSMLSAGRR
jgi:hypothetical protein